MTLKESLIMVIITTCIGLPLSLFVRIKRENISFKDYGSMINLMIKFLIIYPFILFPFIAYFTKENIAESLATEVYKRKEVCRKKTKSEIKGDILRDFNLAFVTRFWFLVLKDMFSNYDEYVNENINLARKIIKDKKTKNHEDLKHKNFKSYQKEIMKNTSMKEMDGVGFC